MSAIKTPFRIDGLLLAGLLILIMAGLLFGRAQVMGTNPSPAGSTYNTGGDGLSALAPTGEAVRRERRPIRLTREIDRLVLWNPGPIANEDWNQLMIWVRQGGILVLSESVPHLSGTVGTAEPTAAHSASAHPITVDVGAVSAGPGFVEQLGRPFLTHLIRADGGPLFVSWQEGRGRIFWSGDSEWLTNARLMETDNLTLGLKLLTPAPGGLTAFDEYHLGPSRFCATG